MRKIRIGICDSDADYGRSLSDYLMQQHGEQVEVQRFGEVPEKVQIEKLDVFLSDILPEIPEKALRTRMLKLTEEKQEEGIFKYQAAGRIYTLLLQEQSDIGAAQTVSTMWVFYTPGYQQYQEEELRELAAAMGENRRILLLQLTQCGGWDESRDGQADLTEIIYGIRQKRYVRGQLKALEESADGFTVILPVRNSMQLAELTSNDMKQLVEKLQESSDWDCILWDVNFLSEAILQLFEMTDIIWSFEQSHRRKQHLNLLVEQMGTEKTVRYIGNWTEVLEEIE